MFKNLKSFLGPVAVNALQLGIQQTLSFFLFLGIVLECNLSEEKVWLVKASSSVLPHVSGIEVCF